MSKLEEAKEILKELGFPKKQQNETSAYTLLALSGLKEESRWSTAKMISMSVVGSKKNAKYPGIMRFVAQHYKKIYAENSRETFRRKSLHQFVQAGFVERNPENPDLPTNSKDNHYRLSKEALKVIKSYKTKFWKKELKNYLDEIGALQDKYTKKRNLKQIPLKLADGKVLKFSPGKHNEVQIAVIKEFGSRFAPGAELLYVGDTAKKDLHRNDEKLKMLNIPIGKNSKLPDVIIYDSKKDWLYLIEAVTSHGPISPKRMLELEELLKNCKSGKIYVTAFPDMTEFKKHSKNIAWETEVWLADLPDHMIHFNGDRFIGPR